MSSLGRFGGSLLPAAVGPAAENTLLAQLKQWTQQAQQCLCEEGDKSISRAVLGMDRPHSRPSSPALACAQQRLRVGGHQPDFGFFRICLCTAKMQKILHHLFLTCVGLLFP